ncbi:putative porin [Fibrella aquatica]|uniref:putative porin n=1 Tax=Fibrella aquatica TaxID=3242487 RepID=UPI0035225B92
MQFSALLFLASFLCLSTIGRAQQFPGGAGTFPTTNGTNSPNGAGRPGGSGAGVGIDDSTKVIYGPTTAKFFLESDVFNNRKRLYLTDTSLIGSHQFEFTKRNDNRYTDLGNLGSPLRPVFYETPNQIGEQQGYYVFSPYGYQTSQVRYYDTKSPFTNMYLVLGPRSQNVLNFDFNQNINPRLNVGFNVQRFTSERQFGLSAARTQTERLLAQNWGLLLHGNYRTKDDRYTLLAHVNHMNHSLPEQGGNVFSLVNGDTLAIDYEGQARLASTLGWERRTNVHVYHQYVPADGIQFFHKLDYQTNINNFEDEALLANQQFSNFYPRILNDSSRTQQDVYWRSIDNTFGVKGIYNRGKSAYNYRLFYRQRIFSQQTDFNLTSTTAISGEGQRNLNQYNSSGFENYVGGWLGYYFPDSLSRLTGEAEYLVGTGAFRLNAQLESRLFTAGFTTMLAQPTLISQRFNSNHYQWNNLNQFGLRGTQHAYGTLNVKYKDWTVSPGADLWLLNNYVYFNQQAEPAQLSTAFTMFRVGLNATYTRARFRASTQLYYTPLNAGDDVLRIPTFFANGRIQYDFIYAKVLHIQTGLELHYKSAFYGDAYSPVSQQYYLQDRQLVEGALLADAFANMRVNRVRFFLKFSHVNQGLFQPGYFVSPGFLQLQRGFGFGVDWLLFD